MQKMPKKNLIPLIVVSVGFFLALALYLNADANRKETEARYRSSLLFSSVMEIVRDEYVDPTKVDYDRLTYAALRGMMTSLDPHSQFMDPEAYESMKSETQGQFGGLGISVGVVDGALTINVPIEGGPGFKAGLIPGDRILKIDGKLTKSLPFNDAVKKLRGDPGTNISLLIYRPSTKEFKDITIQRELINVPTVRDVDILSADITGSNTIGYIRITQFGEKTREEFEKALKTLQGKGMKSLVLDLRNNPGGLLDAAVEVAGKFLPVGTVVVSTEGRFPKSDRALYKAQGRSPILNLPIVVLINSNSASGAEIVAGALKDMRRAILIGETTFGKGSVQTVQPLDQSINPPVALRLTTARYYTPSRKLIHEVGVSPDIEAPISSSDERMLFMRRSANLLSPQQKEELKSFEDVQLRRAIGILRGLELFAQKG